MCKHIGAVYSLGKVVLKKVYFQQNSARRGGAVFNLSPFPNSLNSNFAVTANKVDFYKNVSTHSSGGAIYNEQTLAGTIGKLKIRQSNFRANTSTISGGIREHVFSRRTDIVTINAKLNFWNNPTVSASSNVHGVNTLELLTAKVNFTPDPPQVPPVDPCGLRQCPVATSTPTATPTMQPSVTCYVAVPTNVPEVNVRATPVITLTNVIGLLFAGQSIVVTGKQPGWYQFFAGDVEHWVSEQTVTPTLVNSCNTLPVPITLLPTTPQNSGVYCFNSLTPADALGNCRDRIYNDIRVVYNEFSSQLGRVPTHRELAAVTVYDEWWTVRSINPGIKTIGLEGFSRNYFQQCGIDVCNELELLYFLSGYQPWFIGGLGLSATVDALFLAYDTIEVELTNPQSELSLSVETIVNPTNLSWKEGKQSDKPWQWFNQNTSATRPNIGTDGCTAVLLRVSSLPFEMYTALQNDNIKAQVC